MQSYLQREYSKRRNLRVVDLIDITSGWETEIRSFNLEWESDDQIIVEPLVIRIFPGKDVEGKAKKEFAFMKELRNLNYPVPTVYIVETDSSIIGHPFIVMERISGGTIDDRIQKENESLSYWLDVMCKLFVELHNTNWEFFVSEEIREELNDPYFIINRTLNDYSEC
ncbi:MAG: phosphotransferase family protein [Candidatus Sifarchaeia archaeon]